MNTDRANNTITKSRDLSLDYPNSESNVDDVCIPWHNTHYEENTSDEETVLVITSKRSRLQATPFYNNNSVF